MGLPQALPPYFKEARTRASIRTGVHTYGRPYVHSPRKILNAVFYFSSDADTGLCSSSLPTRVSPAGIHDGTRRPPAHRLGAYSPNCRQGRFSETQEARGSCLIGKLARAAGNDKAPGLFTEGFFRYSVFTTSPDASNHHLNLL